MDATYFEEISGRLRGLLIRLSDRLSSRDQALLTEFIDANELGLALEQLADVLLEYEHHVDVDERADLLALAETMGIGSRISRAVRSLPGGTRNGGPSAS